MTLSPRSTFPTAIPSVCRLERRDSAQVQFSLQCDIAGFAVSIPLSRGCSCERLGSLERRGSLAEHRVVGHGSQRALREGGETLPEVAQLRQTLIQTDSTVLPRLAAAGEAADDAALHRWLIARRWNIHSAAKDLIEHSYWRAQYVCRLRQAGGLPGLQQGGSSKKLFLQGHDTAGHAVVIVRVGSEVLVGGEYATALWLLAWYAQCLPPHQALSAPLPRTCAQQSHRPYLQTSTSHFLAELQEAGREQAADLCGA